MKQLIKLVLGTMLVIGLVSCNIETQRSYAGDLTIEVTGLPAGVVEVALFCNLNDWKAEEVNGTGFVRPVSVDGKVVFDLVIPRGLKTIFLVKSCNVNSRHLRQKALCMTVVGGARLFQAVCMQMRKTICANLLYEVLIDR